MDLLHVSYDPKDCQVRFLAWIFIQTHKKRKRREREVKKEEKYKAYMFQIQIQILLYHCK